MGYAHEHLIPRCIKWDVGGQALFRPDTVFVALTSFDFNDNKDTVVGPKPKPREHDKENMAILYKSVIADDVLPPSREHYFRATSPRLILP